MSNHLRVEFGKPLHQEHEARLVATVTIDLAGRPMNVFNADVLRELSGVLDEIEKRSDVAIVVFRSGKDSGFMAGADVHQIKQLQTASEADHVLRAGQDLFNRVSRLPMPTVAVIHGPCLGGGLEFALACTYRIARDDASTKLGLPETQLGLIPGWGGTQRLPRLVGVARAASMILEASNVSAAKAHKIGLVDALAAPDAFERDVQAFVAAHVGLATRAAPPRGWLAWLQDGTALGRRVVFHFARRQIARHARHYPALPAALHAMEVGLQRGLDAGLAAERAEFSRVIFTPTSRNLLELFFQRERARKRSTWVAGDAPAPHKIETLAVLGAGTMGGGIAQLAALQGYKVILKDVDEPTVQKGMDQIAKLFADAVHKGALRHTEAEKARAAITATADPSKLAQADLVIEAVVERRDIKEKVFREVDGIVPPHALLVSNTSALPISDLAAVTSRPARVGGLHFFNPVHKMPLVEVVRCRETSDETVAALVDVVRQLGKTPIVVAEGPGFLVNRILFPYLDEAVRLVSEGISPAEVDREAKKFGMPMGPVELLDTVGVDVAADVAKTLGALSPEPSPTGKFLADMVAKGSKGKKSGHGFYTYTNGRKGKPAPLTREPGKMAQLPAPMEFAGEKLNGVQQRLAFALINAAGDAMHEGIVAEPWMLDLGMVLGTGFAPFRGGPLRLVETWGRIAVLDTLARLAETCGPRFRPSVWLTQPKSAEAPLTREPLRTADR